MYSAIKATTDETTTTITGTGEIVDADYQASVSFVGETKDGKELTITVFNAINLENLDWTLADKDEVIASLTYQGCYLEDSTTGYEPWEIEYAV